MMETKMVACYKRAVACYIRGDISHVQKDIFPNLIEKIFFEILSLKPHL